MSKDRMDPFKIIELRAQYKVLSEIEEMFPKNSTHRAAKYAVKRMCEILKEIEAVTIVKIEGN